jgi:Glycosyl transferase family 2
VSAPKVTIFTCSYNKPQYAPEAIASVLAQDEPGWEYFILENSDDGGRTRAAIAPLVRDPRIIYQEIDLLPEDRAGGYVTARLLNEYYGKASGAVIFQLSDDDLLEPSCFSRCLAELAAHPEYSAVWFTMWRTVWDEARGRFRPAGSIPAVNAVGVGTGQYQADCRVDGGQVAHRRECLEQIDPPWFPEGRGTAHHADGVFLQKLANRYPFYPVPDHLLTHRATPLSTWDKPS